MDPIDTRIDRTFAYALRCVQYRLPQANGFRPPGYVLALGARYGIIGVAACHHLLVTADSQEMPWILDTIDEWPRIVEDHVRWDIGQRFPFTTNQSIPQLIGRVSSLPFQTYLPLYKKMCPLAIALDEVGQTIASENKAMIYEGWSWFKRKSALRVFLASLHESKEFGLHFFERRQADVDEVPEIALIGE